MLGLLAVLAVLGGCNRKTEEPQPPPRPHDAPRDAVVVTADPAEIRLCHQGLGPNIAVAVHFTVPTGDKLDASTTSARRWSGGSTDFDIVLDLAHDPTAPSAFAARACGNEKANIGGQRKGPALRIERRGDGLLVTCRFPDAIGVFFSLPYRGVDPTDTDSAYRDAVRCSSGYELTDDHDRPRPAPSEAAIKAAEEVCSRLRLVGTSTIGDCLEPL